MNNQPIQTMQTDKGEFNLNYSEAENPREWDNDSKLLLCHNRYNLALEIEEIDSDSESIQEYVKSLDADDYVILPVYMYDHSGLALSTTPFSCQWDSGQIGYIIYKTDGTRQEKDIKEQLNNELRVYEAYLNGEAYCISFENYLTGETDSCGGIYMFSEKDKREVVKDFLLDTSAPEDSIKQIMKEL